MKKVIFIPACFLLLLLTACNRGYEPIAYGSDPCIHCRMTIVDDRFAAELVDDKGKVFKFDDLRCMQQYMDQHKKQGDNLLFVEDYLKQKDGAIDASTAIYLQHESFSSPMNGNYAAFASDEDAKPIGEKLGVPMLRWENLN